MPIGLRVFFRPIWEQPGGDSVLKLNPIGATNVENQESPKRHGEVAAHCRRCRCPFGAGCQPKKDVCASACSDAGCRWPASHPLLFTRSESRCDASSPAVYPCAYPFGRGQVPGAARDDGREGAALPRGAGGPGVAPEKGWVALVDTGAVGNGPWITCAVRQRRVLTRAPESARRLDQRRCTSCKVRTARPSCVTGSLPSLQAAHPKRRAGGRARWRRHWD
jgi:hypothetical protein